MTDIFREIDEDLRRDRLEKLWSRYGHYLIGLAVLIVLATAAVVGWRQYQARERRADSAQYAAALDLARRDQAAAAKAFDELASKAGGGYVILARLQAAASKASAGDVSGAIAAYDALAADGSVEPLYRDLASLSAAQHMLETAEPSAVIERLKPLAAGQSPWRPSALEITALAQLKAGDKKAALDTFKQLADDLTAPQGLRARAAEMITALNS